MPPPITPNNGKFPFIPPTTSGGSSSVVAPKNVDPSSVADYAVQNKLVDVWNPKNAASLYEKYFPGKGAEYSAAGSNNSALNQALLAKMKGYTGTTDPKSISGGAKIAQGMSVGKALGGAQNFLNPPAAGGAPAPKTMTGSTTDPLTGNTTYTFSDGSTQMQPVDPTIAPLYSEAQRSTADTLNQYKLNIDSLTQDRDNQLSALEKEKNTALKTAEAEYARANPYGSGSGKSEFLSSLSTKYDERIQQVHSAFEMQKSQADLTKNTAITNIKSQLDTGIANQRAAAEAKREQEIKDILAEKRLALSEGSAARSEAMLSLALNRDRRADESAARTQAKTIESDFLSKGTASQSLSTGEQYMSSIEAAGDGGGVSALGLLDALVKLDTGGQAIRQGQTNLIEQSGTYSDSLNKFFNKFSGNKVMGANTVLSANQVKQIKEQARKIAQEKISASISSYKSAKGAIDSIKSDYPDETDKIGGYASQLQSAESFIAKYGSEEDKQKAGITDGTTTTDMPVYPGYTYNPQTGNYDQN